jgi:hypothetical protein
LTKPDTQTNQFSLVPGWVPNPYPFISKTNQPGHEKQLFNSMKKCDSINTLVALEQYILKKNKMSALILNKNELSKPSTR